MKQRTRSASRSRVRKRPGYVPEFLLFALLATMVWLGYWAFWSAR